MPYSPDLLRLLRLGRRAKRKEHSAKRKAEYLFLHCIPSHFFRLTALRELGYIEGENIAFEYRYTEGKRDRAPELATELVRLKVDIIVVAGGSGNGRCMFCPGSGTIQAQLGHGS
jgi:hypothetical protein